MAKWIGKKTKHAFTKRDSIVERLAKVRGVNDIDAWMNPPEKYLHDPYLLENIDAVAQRIIKAVHNGEHITIMADVDADGVFACAGMYNYLKDLVEPDSLDYIHSQRSKGHGVDTVIPKDEPDESVKFLSKDTDLLIIVDSSANSVDGCKYVSEEMGIDIIIIDHHHIEVENPYALMTNCQMGGYPNKFLSGSAMVYKVCQVLDDYMALEKSEDFIDLATIGLISDMMNVKEPENRHIIYHGLANINNAGLEQLLKLSKVDLTEELSTTTVSFKVSPAINACTRFDKIELALELLTTDDVDDMVLVAKQMIKLNEQRKADEAEIVEGAIARVNDDHNVGVLIDDEIGSGFRGLIAMQLTTKLHKPTLVLTEFKDENGKVFKYGGSARSIGNLPFKSICEDTRLFNFAHGHEGAFGCEISVENLPKALAKFDEMIDEEDLQGELYYDLELDASEVTEMDIKEIEKFSRIAGQGFSVPVFKIVGLTVEEKTTKKLGNHIRAVMGADKMTVKINAEDDWALMKFKAGGHYGLDIQEHFDENFMTELIAVGQLNLNSFYNYGTRSLEVTKQVFLDDYAIVD